MTTFDRPRWDHERQHLPDDDLDTADLPTVPDKTVKQKAKENERRQQYGDRQDWRAHLRRDAHGNPSPLPKGYHLADEWTLTKGQKTTRTNSIKNAIAKREKRLEAGGVVLRGYQREERRVRYAKIIERERQWKAKDAAHTLYGPYDILSGCQTRAWEVELQRALDWFVDAVSGEPECPEERSLREYWQTHKAFADGHFGYDPSCGWDWSYEVPERGDEDYYRKRGWGSPYLPPRAAEMAMGARADAGF